MALKKVEIELLADKIAVNLINSGHIKIKKDISIIKSLIKEVLIEDVRKEKEIENERIDTSKLFIMAKRKVARREGFIL